MNDISSKVFVQVCNQISNQITNQLPNQIQIKAGIQFKDELSNQDLIEWERFINLTLINIRIQIGSEILKIKSIKK